MRRTHLEHPSQATACGTIATQLGLPTAAFRAATNQCASCSRTLAAIDAGRPAYRGDYTRIVAKKRHRWMNSDRCVDCGLNREVAGRGRTEPCSTIAMKPL